MVLSIYQKTVAFDQDLNHYTNILAFFLKYLFVSIYILNEKYKKNNSVSLKIVDQNTFDLNK